MSEKINQVEPEITSEDIEEVSEYLNRVDGLPNIKLQEVLKKKFQK